MADAEAAPNDPDRLAIHLDGFDGPLDLLLDLARSQKVDLAGISILQLVDQYLAVIQNAATIRLELAADWLVMAAWLAWLKSRLLLPAADRPDDDTEAAADLLALRLHGLDQIRRAAAWLAARPQLGHDVWPRGSPEDFAVIDRSRLALDPPGLVRAYLAAARRAAATRSYTPRPMTLWSVQDALTRLRHLIGDTPPWTTLQHFLPPPAATDTPTTRRAALASTLLAGLELARLGAIELRQDHLFGDIHVNATAPA